MTNCFTDNFGGHKLVGKFTIGKKELISQDKEYNAPTETRVSATTAGLAVVSADGLTYPLWGQNVIDWRNRTKTHDNIPPSVNIYVRYCTNASTKGIAMMSARHAMAPIDEEKWSAAEAQYQSLTVPELQDNYIAENMTAHDYLLRMSLDCVPGDDVRLMKQSVQMLLDIFAKTVSDCLGENLSNGNGFATMEKIV